MRLIYLVALLVSLVPDSVWAQDAGAISPPPECGLLCIESLTLTSSCNPLNTTCVCTNTALNADITACVLANCTLEDQLSTSNYSMHSCGVESLDQTTAVVAVPMAFGALAFLIFGIRVAEKTYLSAGTWGWDDTVITLAMVFWVPIMFLSIGLADSGFGTDLWENTPEDVTRILYLFFWDCILYFPSIALTKISILLFYLRIFQRSSAKVKPIIIGLIVVNVLYGAIFSLISLFQCIPIEGAWLHWTGEYEATCRNINAQGWAGAGINIFLDIATILVPMQELSRLSLSRPKKIQLLLTFSLGFFVTIVSIVRLQSLLDFATTENVTQGFFPIGVWTTIEVPVGIICACLPATRALLKRYFPKLIGKTSKHGHSGSHYLSSGGRSAGYVKPAADGAHAKSDANNKWNETMVVHLRDMDKSQSQQDLCSPVSSRDLP